MSRTMGVDVGTKRVGVAFSDLGGTVATAHSTLEIDDFRDAGEQLAELAAQREAEAAVFGWPIRMDGSEGRAVSNVRRMIEEFQKAADQRGLQVSVDRWDERMTSIAAEDVLIDADLSRKKRRGIVDRVAATRILQSYLDAQDDD